MADKPENIIELNWCEVSKTQSTRSSQDAEHDIKHSNTVISHGESSGREEAEIEHDSEKGNNEETDIHEEHLRKRFPFSVGLNRHRTGGSGRRIFSRKKGRRSSGEVEQEDGEYVELSPLDDSPYPEVRAAVPNRDNNVPHNTLRMWTIGLLMTTLGCALNVLFSLHSPVFAITPFVSAMASWPLGRLWDRVVPDKTVLGIKLNPSPFNIKEHALITIMGNVSFGGGAAYVTDIIVTMRHFYGIRMDWGFQIAAILSSQALGYSIAGLVRRVLVYPASMIWPSNLVTSTFLTNIHLNINHVADHWTISRLRFFSIVLVGSLLWTFLPSFFMPFLSYFSIASWMAPNNIVINQLFGTQHGLGMLPITFDWNQIAGYIGSPLVPPFFAIGNILAAILIIYWFVVPIVQFTNTWYGNYLPMTSINCYDRFQNVYNVSRILTGVTTTPAPLGPSNTTHGLVGHGDSLNDGHVNNTDYHHGSQGTLGMDDSHSTEGLYKLHPDAPIFDEAKYKSYSPIFLSSSYIISYGLSFAAITSTFVHTILFDRQDIWYYWKNSRKEPDDIHMRLMKRYKEVPDWWFAMTFLLFLALAIVSVRNWDTELPVWALFVALIISMTLLIPVSIIYALTNIQVGLNVLTEFIIGYMIPGKPIAMMMFKTFGYITNIQAVAFLQDMKLGHYLKIAPRVLFMAQLLATIWGCIVQLCVMNWAQNSIRDLCKEDQAAGFTCPQATVFFNASVIWGVIGPQRQFSKGQLYYPMLWMFLVGGLLPIFSWLWLKKWPRSFMRYIHWPVFFNGVGYIPPATPYSYGTYCVVGYTFGYWIKRRWFNWWAKYNYSLSSGLDIGLALGSLIIFLIQVSPKVHAPLWWGSSSTNGGAFDNADARTEPLIRLEPGEAFGPTSW